MAKFITICANNNSLYDDRVVLGTECYRHKEKGKIYEQRNVENLSKEKRIKKNSLENHYEGEIGGNFPGLSISL